MVDSQLWLQSNFSRILIGETPYIKLRAVPRAGSQVLISGESLCCAMLHTMFLWLSITPLGNPVVPLEYGRTAVSSRFPVNRKSEVLIPSWIISRKSIVPVGMWEPGSIPGAMTMRGFTWLAASVMAFWTLGNMADSVTIASGSQSLNCRDSSSETWKVFSVKLSGAPNVGPYFKLQCRVVVHVSFALKQLKFSVLPTECKSSDWYHD